MASSCATSLEPATLATGEGALRVNAIAIDETHVYWTAGLDVADGIPSGGTVMRVALAGGAPETLASDLRLPADLVVDAHTVYWLDEFSREVMSVPATGGSPAVITRTNQAWSLAVDETSAYWLDFDVDQRRTIRKAPLIGGTATELAHVPIADASRLDQQLGGIAVDSGRVYWTEAELELVKVMEVPADGGIAMTSFSASSSAPIAGPIAVDASLAYLVNETADYGEGLLAVPLVGGSATLLSGTSSNRALAITLDARNVFWIGSEVDDRSVVMKVPRDGGTAVAIASNLEPVTDIATNGSQICWVSNGSSGSSYSVMCLDSCE